MEAAALISAEAAAEAAARLQESGVLDGGLERQDASTKRIAAAAAGDKTHRRRRAERVPGTPRGEHAGCVARAVVGTPAMPYEAGGHPPPVGAAARVVAARGSRAFGNRGDPCGTVRFGKSRRRQERREWCTRSPERRRRARPARALACRRVSGLWTGSPSRRRC